MNKNLERMYNRKKVLAVLCVTVSFLTIFCSSCGNKNVQGSDDAVDSMNTETGLQENSTEEVFQSQADINVSYGNETTAYADSIEQDFQTLITALPKYKAEFNKEKAAWERYRDAVREVVGFVISEHGSSAPMYVCDVMCLTIDLRSASFRNLLLHVQQKPTSLSKTVFTDAMIAAAYPAFVKAVTPSENTDKNELKKFKSAILKEQKCWNEWMACRSSVSKILPDEIRKIYDGCTNMTRRTKLLQLKNQNCNLGMISGDIMKCALPDDCSDKALLEYPGFDKAWEKYLSQEGL
jgi:hypothetical protein